MTNTPTAQFKDLFKDSEGPVFLSSEVTSTTATLHLHVPHNLSWFEGHFPDQHVLPGVVQVDWVGKLAKALFSELGAFRQLSNIKFKSMILPDTHVSLELQLDADKGNVAFHYVSQSASFSMGTMKFSI
ncbi:ApeI family dehydratase [Alteromonas halophila]|uniref:ApeI dehydratase-like domain-containing protein n=1 Tax=Alteromonas halophila TaxID=516698 RepID=A0A918MXP7_9ALTE|nr:hydroxymyristoyl-ACP dehydratase [Alteromonas halophila]GGW84919.1 hypothetical protein GCM10007391_18390 [Alteromonas halophila]